MKTKTHQYFTLALLPLMAAGAQAQLLENGAATESAVQTRAAEPPYIVEATVSAAKPDGGRLILQLVEPPLLPPPVAPAAVAEVSPELRAARRAEWLARAPLATFILPVTATVYPGGITHLAWRHQMLSGEWQEMEAWSRTDFSSLHVVSDIEIARIRYWIFATVVDGTLRTAGKRAVPAAESLPEDGSFVLLKGDVAETAALAPIQALHEHYLQNGPALAAAWGERLEFARAEEERKRNAPPEDTVIRFWPIESAVYPTQPSSPAAK
jgi:hypothetical protein